MPPPHQALLAAQPVRPVAGCPELVAHQADDVLDLWQRWELATGTRQEPPFWAAVWPGAALLARVILDRPELVRGRNVLDLGCGAGVVGIACKVAGAATVVANDCDPVAVDAALCNARLNGAQLLPRVEDLTLRSDSFTPFQAIVICEMFYERSSAARLCAWASRARAAGASVLVADGERAFLPLSRLELLCEREMPVDARLEGVSKRRARVFRWCASSEQADLFRA